MEAEDRKRFSKGEIKLKVVMAGHIFDLNLFQKTLLGNVFTEVFYKKGVLRNFTRFTGKHLCQGLFFNGLQLY